MFKALKEFLFGKPAEVSTAPYKVEPASTQDTVPIPPPVAKVEATPLNPVKHEWPKAETIESKSVASKPKKVSTRKPKSDIAKEPKQSTKKPRVRKPKATES